MLCKRYWEPISHALRANRLLSLSLSPLQIFGEQLTVFRCHFSVLSDTACSFTWNFAVGFFVRIGYRAYILLTVGFLMRITFCERLTVTIRYCCRYDTATGTLTWNVHFPRSAYSSRYGGLSCAISHANKCFCLLVKTSCLLPGKRLRVA